MAFTRFYSTKNSRFSFFLCMFCLLWLSCNCATGCGHGCRQTPLTNNDVKTVIVNHKVTVNNNSKTESKNINPGNNKLNEEEMMEVRIAEIKDQILKKLRLENPPNATIKKNMIPLPIKEWDFQLKAHENKIMDDFYAKTEQVIVMAENKFPSCPTFFHDPAGCFSFKLANDVIDKTIASAELWVFKLRDARDQYNQTYYVSEFVKGNYIVGRRTKTVAIRDTQLKDGWLKFDVSSTVRRWIQKSNVSNGSAHTLEVSCKTCAMDQDKIPVSNDPGEQPFIIINLGHQDDLRRNQRGVRCESNTTGCCLETLFVNFNQVGWGDWIYQPQGYFANYCKGKCLGDITRGTTTHSSILQRYIMKHRKNLTEDEVLNLSPCCTATNTSPLSIFYDDGNGQIKLDSIPHMTVDSCGCN